MPNAEDLTARVHRIPKRHDLANLEQRQSDGAVPEPPATTRPPRNLFCLAVYAALAVAIILQILVAALA